MMVCATNSHYEVQKPPLDYFPFYDALVDFLSSSTPALSHALLFHCAPISYGGTSMRSCPVFEWANPQLMSSTRLLPRGNCEEPIPALPGSSKPLPQSLAIIAIRLINRPEVLR